MRFYLKKMIYAVSKCPDPYPVRIRKDIAGWKCDIQIKTVGGNMP